MGWVNTDCASGSKVTNAQSRTEVLKVSTTWDVAGYASEQVLRMTSPHGGRPASIGNRRAPHLSFHSGRKSPSVEGLEGRSWQGAFFVQRQAVEYRCIGIEDQEANVS